MVIPGARDEVIEEERAITVKVASPRVPGSPHYRLMLRNRAVRAALEHFRPDLIECQDAYNCRGSQSRIAAATGRRPYRRLHDRFPDRLR